MASSFDILLEEFTQDLEAIRSLVKTFNNPHKPTKERLASANSATLLVAATFEEFAREMARAFARIVVTNTESFDKLPQKLASTAWKRTMEGLSKVRFDGYHASTGTEKIFGAAQARFTVIYEFCRGDLTQDIYRDLIHNENNMRPSELNALFKVSGLGDICKQLSDKQPVLDMFGATESDRAHSKLISQLEDFFERRNTIAHALKRGQSNGPNQIINDINMLESLGKALCETLNSKLPRQADNLK